MYTYIYIYKCCISLSRAFVYMYIVFVYIYMLDFLIVLHFVFRSHLSAWLEIPKRKSLAQPYLQPKS